MKKILSLAFVAMLSLALAAPAYAGRGHGGGFHGGHHNGFHHGGAFHRGCCWGGAFVGGVFVGSAFAYPYYGYPYYAYPYYASPYYPYAYPMYAEPAYQPQTQVTVAPPHPAGRLLHRGLLPSARRWSDGRLFVDLGAGRPRAAPGSAEPLGPAPARSCLGPPWWTVRRPFLVLASLHGTGSPRECRHAGSTERLGVR